jgi:hypothetical protein
MSFAAQQDINAKAGAIEPELVPHHTHIMKSTNVCARYDLGRMSSGGLAD